MFKDFKMDKFYTVKVNIIKYKYGNFVFTFSIKKNFIPMISFTPHRFLTFTAFNILKPPIKPAEGNLLCFNFKGTEKEKLKGV